MGCPGRRHLHRQAELLGRFLSSRPTLKAYDQAYFDRWYRGPNAPRGDEALARHVALAVAVAESILDRTVQTVLDVGCGEGRWQPVLRTLRPEASYLGLDSSGYAVERFGAERNLLRGSFADLELHAFEDPFDLVVCADVLHYLTDEEILAGIDTLADLVGGAAVIEVFTTADPALGDREGFRPRSPDWYRRVFENAGLIAVGLQHYVHRETAELLDAMDRPG